MTKKPHVALTMSLSSFDVQHPAEGLGHRDYLPVSESAKALHIALHTVEEIEFGLTRLRNESDQFVIKAITKGLLVDINALIELTECLHGEIRKSAHWDVIPLDTQQSYQRAAKKWHKGLDASSALLRRLRNKIGAHRDFKHADEQGRTMTWEDLCGLWDKIDVEGFLPLYDSTCEFLVRARRVPVHTYQEKGKDYHLRVIYAEEQGGFRLPLPDGRLVTTHPDVKYSPEIDRIRPVDVFFVAMEPIGEFQCCVFSVGTLNLEGWLPWIEKELAKKRVKGSVLFDLGTSGKSLENRYFRADFDWANIAPLKLVTQEGSQELASYSTTIVSKNAQLFAQDNVPSYSGKL
jgi:hypothetical protein